METRSVTIQTQYIKLDQLLKFSGAAESGAMAKQMVLSGEVLIGGQVCAARGKKLYPGDEVTVRAQGGALLVRVAQP